MKMKMKQLPLAVVQVLSISLGMAALTVAVCPAALAQSSEGSIYGQAKGSATVTIKNIETGATRELKSDGNGKFTFSKLSPGKYTVSSGGATRDAIVVLGSGTSISFDTSLLETIQVTSRGISAIDVSSVESATVFTQDQIQALPVVRDVNAIAYLAPGVVKGDTGLGAGGLPSFGGASVAENGYYINGFDVTNIRNFLSYANLPFDAIGQQQIKTGGYGAEYGRSLGGVISLVTKRGTNEWKSGGAVYWTPSQLRLDGQNVRDRNPDTANGFTVFSKADKSDALSYNVYTGGSLIKDKLFFFALAEGKRDVDTNYGQSQATEFKSDKPNGLLKVDWQITDNHQLEFTGISNKKKSTITDYTNAQPYSTSKDGAGRESTNETGGNVLIGKYTGHFTDSFTASALVGKVDDLQSRLRGARIASLDCPVVLETNVAEIGCFIGPFPSAGVRDPKAPDDRDKRDAYRLDFEYALASHTIRAGYDAQQFKSAAAGFNTYSGGFYYRYFVTPASGTINGVRNAAAPGTQYVRRRISTSTSGEYAVDNTAAYIEDSWRVTKNILLYAGLRSESFNNKNGDGISFVKADNLLAPRLGFAWDVMGDASLKVYGNAGSYFIPVASNTNIRATRGELFEQRFFLFNGRDPRTAAPLSLSAEIGNPQIINDGKLANPATISDTKLKPMSQDEYILGFQKALNRSMTFGVKGTYRKIKNGFDDFCNNQNALAQWAADNGYKNFDPTTAASCVLLNPGRDLTLKVDLNNDGILREVTVPARYLGLAPYTRKYEAVEFTFDRPFDGTWGVSGSYVYSKSRGTTEGYVNSIINQEDAGVSQDFDYGSFTDGTNGYLPNDRRHVIKIFGNYAVTSEFRLGFNSTAASGRPKSCIGFVPPTVSDFDGSGNYTTASTFYCLNDKGVSELRQRGTFGRTPWTYALDLSLAYIPKIPTGKLTLQMDIFNILNSQKATETNEIRDFSRQTSNASSGNQLNQNYGQPTAFQSPREVRLTARYEF